MILFPTVPQDNRTYAQRYFINADYYEPGGPIYINIGGEGLTLALIVTVVVLP